MKTVSFSVTRLAPNMRRGREEEGGRERWRWRERGREEEGLRDFWQSHISLVTLADRLTVFLCL